MRHPVLDSCHGLSPAIAWAGCSVLLVAASIGDYSTGPLLAFDLFYLVPILLAARSLGRGVGLGFAAISAACSIAVQVRSGYPPNDLLVCVWIGLVKLGLWALAAWLVSELQRQLDQREMLVIQLRSAASEVRRLSGLLRVCAWCRKLRTGEGSWVPLEDYLQECTDASVTHSICPECARKATGHRKG